jgi:protein-tyrosine phosphatase
MDRSNLATLRALAPPATQHKLHLFLGYTLGVERDVPDPYYGGPEGFDTVYNMLFEGCSSLIGRLEEIGS